jgi:Arc/MetJ-type ribon-helix-helix transcriptional regulator
MRSERVTVSLPADLLSEARNAVRRGAAASISAYIAEAVAARQLRERSLATLADLYGGPPPPDELAEARKSLRLVPPAAAV